MHIFHPWVAEFTNGMQHICDDEGQREFVLGFAIEFSFAIEFPSPVYVEPPDNLLGDWGKGFL